MKSKKEILNVIIIFISLFLFNTKNYGQVNEISTDTLGGYMLDGSKTTNYGTGSGTEANYCSYFGYYSGNSVSGSYNSYFGAYAGGHLNSSGYSNTFFGTRTGMNITSGSENTLLGMDAGYYNNSGNDNVMVGYRAGFSSEESNNTFIGYKAGYYNEGTGNIFLGYMAASNTAWENVDSILYIDNQNTTNPLIYGDFSARYLKINGNMGIGVDDPDEKLEVDGKIICEEIKVETVGADYVFDNDYKLKNLNHLEKYIKENKHLPDVPSAKTMQNEGVELGKMNTTLLKKIEELTLYVIDQNKEIEKLKKQNKVLNKRINQIKNQ